MGVLNDYPEFSENEFVREFDGIAKAKTQNKFQNKLAEFVYHSFYEARDHKQMCGIDDCMKRDLRARRGIYNPEEQARIDEDENVYYAITAKQVHAGTVWIGDIYEKAGDDLVALSPTPIPELTPELEDVVVASLEQELLNLTALNGIVDEQNITEIAQRSRDLAIDQQVSLGQEYAANHERLIRDQLEEGNFRRVWNQFNEDLFTHKSAILKGPIILAKLKLSYDPLGNPVRTRKAFPCYERVSPFDFYPSPDATGTQPDEAKYVIHRIRACKEDIWKLSVMPGVDVAQINKVFSENPEGHYDCEEDTGYDLGHNQKDKSNRTHRNSFYELIMYYGVVPGRLLLEYGDITGISPNRDYEAQLIVSGDVLIRAILNPYPRNMRPFHSNSFRCNNEGFWGTSLPEVLRDTQKKSNAAVRALVKNLGYSSGFIGETDASRVSDEEDVENLFPYRNYMTKGSRSNSSPVIRLHTIPSTVPQMIQLNREFEREASELSGIPATVLGSPGLTAPPRTTGVLALLLGGSARFIKYIVGNNDLRVLEPALTMQYDLNMLLSEDPSIRSDAVIRARGASGIVERDIRQQRQLEFLQIIVQAPNVRQEGIDSIYRSMAESFGFDPDAFIDDPNRASDLALRAGLATGGAGLGDAALAGDLSSDVLDGRNQPVVDAALGNNGLPF